MAPPKNRRRYPPVSALDVCPEFSGSLFEIEQNPTDLHNPLNYRLFASVPTALEGTLPKASHREYRPKRVLERANVGMEWIGVGTLELTGRPGNDGVQAKQSRFQKNVIFVISQSPEASTSTSGQTVSTACCWTSKPQPGKTRR